MEVLSRSLKGTDLDVTRLLAIGDEAIEVEVGVELTLLRQEEVEGVDLVDFHKELRRVLDRYLEGHVRSRREELRIGPWKLDVDAFF